MESCSVMWLNKSAKRPNSSRRVTGIRRLKSPCATERAPFANDKIGSTKRCAKYNAVTNANKIANNAANTSVIIKNVCKPFCANTNSAYLDRADSINSASFATLSGIGCLKNNAYCSPVCGGNNNQPLAYKMLFKLSALDN